MAISNNIRQRQPRAVAAAKKNTPSNSNILEEGTKLRQLEEQLARREKQQITNALQTNSSNLLAKMYLVILVVCVIVLAVVILVLYKDQIFGAKTTTAKSSSALPKKHPTIFLMTLFPPHISPRNDFTRFQGSWVYATPENKPTRDAVTKTIRQREALRYKRNQGNPKVIMRAWEQAELLSYMYADRAQQYCGEDVLTLLPPLPSDTAKKKNINPTIYGANRSPSFDGTTTTITRTTLQESLQQDIYIWCLIASKAVDGYVDIDLELENSFGDQVWKEATAATTTTHTHPTFQDDPDGSSLSLPSSKSVAIRLSDERILASFIRFGKNEGEFPPGAPDSIPAKMLQWLKKEAYDNYYNQNEEDLNTESSQLSLVEYRQRYEQHLNLLIVRDIHDTNEKNWMFLASTCSFLSKNGENAVEEEDGVGNEHRIARYCRTVENDRQECCNIFLPGDEDEK